jgi:peroxiredoxin
MAGWCGTCIPEAQAWSELYPVYKDQGLEALMVSADPNDTSQTIAAFKRAGGIGNLPWAIDKTGEFTRSLDVRALDTTIIINREGKIAYSDAVPTPYETLDKELKEVV